jgi:hypothetical protein
MTPMPHTLPIRDEPPLGPTDLIVRGGEMKFESVYASARICFRKYGVWAISVCARSGATLEEIRLANPNLSTWPKYLVSTPLELAGFELLPTFRTPAHYSLLLPGELTEELHASVLGLFREAPGP